MKTARIIVKSLFFAFLVLVTAVFCTAAYLENSVSKELKIKQGESLSLDLKVPVTAVYDGNVIKAESTFNTVGKEYEVDLKMFGVIPFSTVNVEVVDEMQVALLGKPFGMKIYTEGVLVVDMTDFDTPEGLVNPAKQAGIKIGDYIISVNGEKVYSNEDLCEKVLESGGQKMKFVIMRNKTKIHLSVKPVISSETEGYKIGIWVRDSSAGIGTLTFYSPAANIVCGLGHGICDEDTDALLKISSGEIVDASIVSVKKGCAGCPGQLNGKLKDDKIGDILLNSNEGVYSSNSVDIDCHNLIKVALKQEVTNGEAEIFCTVDGEKPELYTCEIKIRPSSLLSKTQNLLVTVTDKRLLDKTGGIVQGLSGSPVIQNGKLIGAITHVLVDDPTTGYAIFAENMLETAQSVANENKLKDAS